MVLSISARVLPYRPACAALVTGILALGVFETRAEASPVAPGPAAFQPQEGRPDQLFRENPRNKRVTTITGQVTENSLTTVLVQIGNKEEKIPAAEVLRIEWGVVPPSFKDGESLLRGGDFENAVAQFRIAAGDASARPVVQAAARLRSAEALMRWGASDNAQFAEAATEAARFVEDNADNREIPKASMLQARALRLSGQPAEAAAIYEGLYQKGVAATDGYAMGLCLDAALEAAECFLETGDSGTLKARELFAATETGFADLAGSLDEAEPAVLARLANQRGAASVGEGFCLLVSGDANGARSFFEGRLRKAGAPPAELHAARLGLAKVHLAAGEGADAMVLFAQVSALDASSPDRVAAALLGLAESALAATTSNATEVARTSLKRVVESYGDTPSAAAAAERLSKL